MLNQSQIDARLIGNSSIIDSYLMWRNVFQQNMYGIGSLFKEHGYTFPGAHAEYMKAMDLIFGTGLCEFCGHNENDGAGRYHIDGKPYWCLCFLLRDILRKGKWTSTTDFTYRKPDSLLDPLVTKDKQIFAEIRRKVMKWIDTPTRWMVLSGKPGTGKTHTMEVMMTAWQRIASFHNAADLRSALMKSIGDNTNSDLIANLVSVPILFIDDLGVEHQTDWGMSQLEHIIVSRSSDDVRNDRITVIGTNIPAAELAIRTERTGVSRIGSRLLDNNVVWLDYMVTDFRGTRR